MASVQHKRPFPRELFARLSKSECESFIELLHYTAESDNVDDVKSVLVRFQKLFPFTRVIGGLAKLGPAGTFEGFTNVLNASYPEEWLRLYWQKGYFDVDPVFQTALQQAGTQHWAKTYHTSASEKQREFIEAAKAFGLGDGITTGSIDSACGIATFCSFAASEPVDAERYLQLIEYFGYHIHLALLRTSPPRSQSLDQCVRELTLREMTILNWMKNGKTNGEIGQILGVTERTVRFHVESIFSKLDVTSRSQAVATAIEHGLPNVV